MRISKLMLVLCFCSVKCDKKYLQHRVLFLYEKNMDLRHIHSKYSTKPTNFQALDHAIKNALNQNREQNLLEIISRLVKTNKLLWDVNCRLIKRYDQKRALELRKTQSTDYKPEEAVVYLNVREQSPIAIERTAYPKLANQKISVEQHSPASVLVATTRTEKPKLDDVSQMHKDEILDKKDNEQMVRSHKKRMQKAEKSEKMQERIQKSGKMQGAINPLAKPKPITVLGISPFIGMGARVTTEKVGIQHKNDDFGEKIIVRPNPFNNKPSNTQSQIRAKVTYNEQIKGHTMQLKSQGMLSTHQGHAAQLKKQELSTKQQGESKDTRSSMQVTTNPNIRSRVRFEKQCDAKEGGYFAQQAKATPASNQKPLRAPISEQKPELIFESIYNTSAVNAQEPIRAFSAHNAQEPKSTPSGMSFQTKWALSNAGVF